MTLCLAMPTLAATQKDEKEVSEKVSEQVSETQDFCQDLSFNGDEELEGNPALHRAISHCLGPKTSSKDLALKE